MSSWGLRTAQPVTQMAIATTRSMTFFAGVIPNPSQFLRPSLDFTNFPALSLPKSGRDEDGAPSLLPRRIQFPNRQRDDFSPTPIKFDAVAARGRINAVGKDAF